jgi:hypothetical protein
MNVVKPTLRLSEANAAGAQTLSRVDVRTGFGLVGLLLAYGLVIDRLAHPSLAQLMVSLGNFGALSLYSGLLVACAFMLLCLVRPDQRASLGNRAYWLAIACVLTTLTFPFFAAFKELVLPMRGFLWDRTFAHVGRAIFGQSPWTITHVYFGTVAGTRILDAAYRSLLPLMFGLPLISGAMIIDARLRFRILFTWTASWILIGTLAAWVFASAGPCFYNSFVAYDPDYANLQSRLAEIGRQASAQGHPIASLQYESGLMLTYRTHSFAPGGGISAMPSMHVAMMTLVALVAWQFNRLLGVAAWFLVLAVWIATIHFGWHYFVDGPVGAAMMIALWILAKRVSAVLHPIPQQTAKVLDSAASKRS